MWDGNIFYNECIQMFLGKKIDFTFEKLNRCISMCIGVFADVHHYGHTRICHCPNVHVKRDVLEKN